MSLPRELVYIQEISNMRELIAADERAIDHYFSIKDYDQGNVRRGIKRDRDTYLDGLRRAAQIIWGQAKEHELYDRAISPDDTTM